MGRTGGGGRTGGAVRRGPVSLVRALSKLGFASRSRAAGLILSGRVAVNGRPALEPGLRVDPGRDVITVDGIGPAPEPFVHILLNKPRGLVTTAADEKGRPTVYECLKDAALPRVVPVGRLDMASEGLLMFTNDTRWADRLLDPRNRLPRVYRVQVRPRPDPGLCLALTAGTPAPDGGRLAARSARILRTGTRTGWLEVVLEEGRNREVRRLLEARGLEVRRLVRVAFGPLVLGDLPKGTWRALAADELEALDRALPRPARNSSRP